MGDSFKINYLFITVSVGISVSKVTGYVLNDRGLYLHHFQTGCAANPHSYPNEVTALVNGTNSFSRYAEQ
jgi:hypothetical protein